MSYTSIGAGSEARQSMIRVWLALSAVWVAFWLLIAGIVLAAVEMQYPLAEELGSFASIVLVPPLALLGLGAIVRWTFELLSRAGPPRQSAR